MAIRESKIRLDGKNGEPIILNEEGIIQTESYIDQDAVDELEGLISNTGLSIKDENGNVKSASIMQEEIRKLNHRIINDVFAYYIEIGDKANTEEFKPLFGSLYEFTNK